MKKVIVPKTAEEQAMDTARALEVRAEARAILKNAKLAKSLQEAWDNSSVEKEGEQAVKGMLYDKGCGID